MTQVVVIDYGMGNLHSVSKAIQAVSSSESIVISSNTDVIKAADKLVFPGVGAIKDCMEAFSVDLRRNDLTWAGAMFKARRQEPLGFLLGASVELKYKKQWRGDGLILDDELDLESWMKIYRDASSIIFNFN